MRSIVPCLTNSPILGLANQDDLFTTLGNPPLLDESNELKSVDAEGVSDAFVERYQMSQNSFLKSLKHSEETAGKVPSKARTRPRFAISLNQLT